MRVGRCEGGNAKIEVKKLRRSEEKNQVFVIRYSLIGSDFRITARRLEDYKA